MMTPPHRRARSSTSSFDDRRVMIAQVWDDRSLLNVDFSVICSAYTLKDINTLEKKFLELIE